MKNSNILLFALILWSFGCNQTSEIETLGRHYQKYQDYASLHKVVELMKPEIDTTYVKSILGEPIDMGFDYRYLTDSTGVNGCSVGGVFHIDSEGQIDQRWVDEICE